MFHVAYVALKEMSVKWMDKKLPENYEYLFFYIVTYFNRFCTVNTFITKSCKNCNIASAKAPEKNVLM